MLKKIKLKAKYFFLANMPFFVMLCYTALAAALMVTKFVRK
jgi:hypothetical protein